ncbi:hypothetical protein [Streptomyces sp. NPDC056491]|uniref:hypothetical protein n=1 Tax=Streptomyces sp. NPDC056491 TaxID=3345837 RepID=UPI0036826354
MAAMNARLGMPGSCRTVCPPPAAQFSRPDVLRGVVGGEPFELPILSDHSGQHLQAVDAQTVRAQGHLVDVTVAHGGEEADLRLGAFGRRAVDEAARRYAEEV